jgi:hypothetical protein
MPLTRLGAARRGPKRPRLPRLRHTPGHPFAVDLQGVGCHPGERRIRASCASTSGLEVGGDAERAPGDELKGPAEDASVMLWNARLRAIVNAV